MDIQKEREAFEVALNIDEYIGRSEVAFSVENGCYELTAPEDVAGNISISKLYKLNSMFKAWQAAKASVPEVVTIGNELQSWVAAWSFKARHDREDYIVVDANLLAKKIAELTGASQ